MNVSQHVINEIDAGCTLQTFATVRTSPQSVSRTSRPDFALYAAPTTLKPTFPSSILEVQALCQNTTLS
jgi:hypothetical protein